MFAFLDLLYYIDLRRTSSNRRLPLYVTGSGRPSPVFRWVRRSLGVSLGDSLELKKPVASHVGQALVYVCTAGCSA